MSDSPDGARHTPLFDAHVSANAVMTEFTGWAMPLRYGSEMAEHTAVRTTAGLFGLSQMGEIENERAVGFEAEVSGRGNHWALLAVRGPNAAAILAPLTDDDLSELRYYEITPSVVHGCRVQLARTGYTGEDGFEIFCAPDDVIRIWEAGGPYGLVLAGLACRDSLRLEAGMPLYGHELSADLTPYPAGFGRVVRLDKASDFVGRAALAKAAANPPARVLAGLVPQGRRSPRAGCAVLDPETGPVVGQVTSGAPSPALARPVAMAYIDAPRAMVGEVLDVDVGGAAEPAGVVELPFYRRVRAKSETRS